MTNQAAPQRSVIAVLFGLGFTILGGLFMFLIVREFVATIDTYTWKKVPAQITSIDIEYPKQAPRGRERGVFELSAKYRYSFNGVERQGDRLRRTPYTDASYETLADRKWQLIADEHDYAYVDSSDPAEAILERGSLWFGLLVLFPIPFVLIGVACVASGMGFLADTKRKPTPASRKPTQSKNPAPLLLLLGAVFFIAGIAMIYGLSLLPWMRGRAAQSWAEMPCQVVWSRVRVHEDDDGSDTYSPDIFYRYQFGGETFHSNRYSFAIGSSSGRSAKQRIVRQFPAGKQTSCYVNPAKPWHAVLNRDRSIGFLWIIGVVFATVGAIVFRTGMSLLSTRRHEVIADEQVVS